MDTTPLLPEESPADPSFSPPLAPCEGPVDDNAKNGQEPGASAPSLDCESNKGSEETEKTAGVPSPGKKRGRKSWFPRWTVASFVGGRGATEAGAGDGSSSGGKGATGAALGSGIDARKNNEHVLDIDKPPSSPTSSATTATGGAGAGARRSFPSSSRTAAAPPERKTGRIDVLIERAKLFAGLWSGHAALADPSANLAAALLEFEATENAATAAGLHAAAAILYRTAIGSKLPEQPAGVAKHLATEAMALAAGDDLAASISSASASRSPEVLFYIAIPGSVGLLPYLNTVIPKNLHPVVAVLFGAVFAGATVGALLIARARDKVDLETATIVGAVTFTAFSFLVIVFVAFALLGGNIVLICVLAAILAGLHIYAWARK